LSVIDAAPIIAVFLMAGMTMTLVLSLIVLLVLFSGVFLILRLNSGSRAGQLRQCADQLGLEYRPYAALSKAVRQAAFYVLEAGEFRHFRHLLEGSIAADALPPTTVDRGSDTVTADRAAASTTTTTTTATTATTAKTDKTVKSAPSIRINLLDYSLIHGKGTASQTLLMLHCPLNTGRFRIETAPWLTTDAFSEQQSQSIRPMQSGQLHPQLRHLSICSEQPASMANLLHPAVRDWLLAHPHLHIEWSHGILLLYRPHHLLSAEQLPLALAAGCELVALLQQSSEPGGQTTG
jgi:hypothetical protein